jgi:hypothetical protein
MLWLARPLNIPIEPSPCPKLNYNSSVRVLADCTQATKYKKCFNFTRFTNLAQF